VFYSKKNRIVSTLLVGLFFSFALSAQDEPEQNQKFGAGELHGNFQFTGQLYLRDTIIDPTGEFYPDERFLGQGFANLVYSNGPLKAGLRYENYQNVMLGFPEGFRGEGVVYRFINFKHDNFDITAGSFYEQFGSGMALRAYEEPGLGFDNFIDGTRIIYTPIKGVRIKGVLGRQRIYFDNSPGIIRGLDGEFTLNDFLTPFHNTKTRVTLGGSFVSRYQAANNPFFNIPENVALGSGRLNLTYEGLTFFTEFTYKVNDPSADNGYIFRPGNGLITNVSYTKGNWSGLFMFKRIDNMSFRSNRDGLFLEGLINFLPAISKVHTYALPGLYPFATQINGEFGLQFELAYTIPRGSKVGGKYGALVALNISDASSIWKDPIPKTDTLKHRQLGYNTEFWRRGQIQYFRDINLRYEQKLNKTLKYSFTYFYLEYNRGVLEDGMKDEVILEDPSALDMVYANTVVGEFLVRLKPKHYLRTEIQWLVSDQYRGSMFMVLGEYSISPNWFIAFQAINNYGHPDESQQIVYPLGSIIYVKNTSRIQLSYGRQQQGIFCVGGVCRVVPPSNGLSMSFTTSF